MNLKEVYEIFYPGKCKENPSVWNVPPKYRSKKDFFEELLPMEIRWINCIWHIPTAGFAEQNGRNAKLNGRLPFDY